MKISDAHTHYGKHRKHDMPFMSATFEEVLQVIAAIQCAKISRKDKENIFYRNAERFYGIKL